MQRHRRPPRRRRGTRAAAIVATQPAGFPPPSPAGARARDISEARPRSRPQLRRPVARIADPARSHGQRRERTASAWRYRSLLVSPACAAGADGYPAGVSRSRCAASLVAAARARAAREHRARADLARQGRPSGRHHRTLRARGVDALEALTTTLLGLSIHLPHDSPQRAFDQRGNPKTSPLRCRHRLACGRGVGHD